MKKLILSLLLCFVCMAYSANPQINVYSRSTAVTIDGNLSEWNLDSPDIILTPTNKAYIPKTGSGITNDADCSAKYYISWDTTALYIAILRTDDKLCTPGAGSPEDWADDAFEFFISSDYNNSNQDTQMPRYGNKGWQIIISISERDNIVRFLNKNNFKELGTRMNNAECAAEGFTYAFVTENGKTTFEAKFLFSGSFMTGIIPKKGTQIGFSCVTDDNDNGIPGKSDGYLCWTRNIPTFTSGNWGKIILAIKK